MMLRIVWHSTGWICCVSLAAFRTGQSVMTRPVEREERRALPMLPFRLGRGRGIAIATGRAERLKGAMSLMRPLADTDLID